MKKYLVLATLLLTSLLSFALENQPSRYKQFGLNRAHFSHKSNHKVITHRGVPFTQPSARCSATLETHANPEIARTGHFAKPAIKLSKGSNSVASTISFVAAVDTPMGGTDDGETEAVMGDFNGDGNMDVAKIVTNTVCDAEVTQLSVVLGNGDGTFQAAQLTTLPADTDGPILVADLNGDKNDDLIVTEGRDFFVLLSNGDGTFTVGNSGTAYTITATQFVLGGLLTDVNGDGKLDVLAFDNAVPGNVIELLANGDGTFQAATTLGQLTTSAPNNMFFADFDGDGKIDFAGQLESGQLQVTLATGSGVFANAPVSLVTSDTQYNACSSTAGDLTGDGKPEIVSVNCNQNTITTYVNTGTGTFGTGLYYDANFNDDNFPSEATIADINGDGKNDIVVSDSESGTISVFLGHGDGTVTAESLAYDTGQFPFTAPLVADFNGDGLLDVVIPDNAFSFVYLQGFGDGTFRAAPSYPLPDTFVTRAASFSVATGDFNGDGIPDVVVGAQGNTSATGMVVYLGKGDGSFLPGVNYGAQTDASFLAVADFNGDGIPDAALVDSSTGTVQIFLGNGDGTFNEGATYPTDPAANPAPSFVATGDFNKDGKVDLAISNDHAKTVDVFLGNGDGTFGSFASYPITGLNPQSVTVADLNADGSADLLVPATVVDGSGSLAILLNKADGSGTFNAATLLGLTGSPQYVAVGDLDKDGKADVAITQFGGTFAGTVTIALGKGDGTFNAPVDYASSALDGGAGNASPEGISVLDLDGDGNPDLIYLNSNYGTVAVMTGKGDGTVNTPVEFPTTAFVWGMALADLNKDGTMDVVVGNNESGGFSVLLNGAGTGTSGNFTVGTQTPSQTVAAGSPAAYTIDLSGQNGYSGTITFACSNLPTGATCTFSPTSVIANGNVPLSTTLTISTTGTAAAALRSGSGSGMLLASLTGMGLFGLFLAGGTKRRQHGAKIVLGCVLLLMLGTLVGCSGSSSKTVASTVTPAGAYLVTVTSTGTGASAPTHIVNLTLVVQ